MPYDPAISNIPIPILEFLNVSFIEKDSIEVKFGDLFGSETINVNFQTVDIVYVSAPPLANMPDVEIINPLDGQVLKYDSLSKKWKNSF